MGFMDEIVKPEPLVMSWCQLLWAHRWAALDAPEKGTCAFVCQTVGKEPTHHLPSGTKKSHLLAPRTSSWVCFYSLHPKW